VDVCKCGYFDNWVGVLVICVLVFTVFCIACTLFCIVHTVFLHCFVYVYLFLFVFSVPVYELLPPTENFVEECLSP
jgi:hypothetical protein